MKPKYVAVANHPELKRNSTNMAVVNTDTQAKQRYILQRDKILQEKQRITSLETKVDNLTILVTQLIEQLNNSTRKE